MGVEAGLGGQQELSKFPGQGQFGKLIFIVEV
jgi:hypothetical protein